MYIEMYKRSIAEARSDLSRLVREAESGKAVELTRRGESVAFLIGRREYERLLRPGRFSEAWDEFAAEVDLKELQIDPDEIFADVRDQRPGRDARL
jgi:prevent-host-death family protein